MIKELIKLANELDSRGLVKEADYLDSIIKKEAIAPIMIALCFAVAATGASGCKPVSKDDLSSETNGEIDFEFIYDDSGAAIDVNPVCNGDVNNHSCAEKSEEGNQIILSWKCKNYEFLRDAMHMDTGDTGMLSVELTWELDNDGRISRENIVSGHIKSC